MKYFMIFLLLPCLSQAQITGGDVTASDTVFVKVESGEVESVMYYRLNYVEISGGARTFQRTPPEQLPAFLQRLASEKERWSQAIMNVELDIARLQELKEQMEAMEGVIDQAISDLE